MRPRLLASAQRMLKNDEEAKDIVQDALLKLWQLRDEPIQHPEAMALVILLYLRFVFCFLVFCSFIPLPSLL